MFNQLPNPPKHHPETRCLDLRGNLSPNFIPHQLRPNLTYSSICFNIYSFTSFTQSCLSTPKLSSCSVAKVCSKGKKKGLSAAALLPFTQTPPTHADGFPGAPNTKSQTPPFGIGSLPRVPPLTQPGPTLRRHDSAPPREASPSPAPGGTPGPARGPGLRPPRPQLCRRPPPPAPGRGRLRGGERG